ncbi:hypothetical protein EDC18_101292 [Natranaerovirga pectinivora]|uniref:Uncharacterized protein n=1 Tax=Natranaerovirga pectinivora TaxID=682400 RepID=A0A4R3MUM3_9FIRM|nr:hypothetical protein [Natranaerovirga pectinivora]TCT16996.1 hypothetical protein EDC18_101292 [Natranaerovirga pectinivora]
MMAFSVILLGLILGSVFLIGIVATIIILINQNKRKGNDDGFR